MTVGDGGVVVICGGEDLRFTATSWSVNDKGYLEVRDHGQIRATFAPGQWTGVFWQAARERR
jgi:hypothetical protein